MWMWRWCRYFNFKHRNYPNTNTTTAQMQCVKCTRLRFIGPYIYEKIDNVYVNSFFFKFLIHSCFPEPGYFGIGASCPINYISIWPIAVFADAVLRSKTPAGPLNHQSQSDAIHCDGTMLCGHRTRYGVLKRILSL